MLNFYKYHGLGNDFILVDNRDNSIEAGPQLAAKMCHRFFGIGADGLISAESSSRADIRMIIYNSDGSRAEMCGNGLRCFTKFAYEKLGVRKDRMIVETDAGILNAGVISKDLAVAAVKVNMGRPVFESERIPCTIKGNPILDHEINIGGKAFKITGMFLGVPHTVIFTDEIEDETVVHYGKLIENSDIFPGKTNVNFVKIKNNKEIILRTWERGAGYTYACGTGACASVVAGILNGLLSDDVLVHLRGGDLNISWPDKADVFMEGPAEEVYKGEYILK
ncbi:MAG TPA: diaminopimelate epimerase [Clostridia bacterium]|nr:diaminopimelate epimerase [Clostridia bacterium]